MLAERWIRFALRHRVGVLFTCALITGGALWILPQAVLASSMIRLFFDDNPAYDVYRDLSAQFGSNDLTVVAFKDPALFQPESWERLDTITKTLESHEDIKRVESIGTSNRIRGTDDTLEVTPYSDAAENESPEALRDEILNHRYIPQLLVAGDGCCAAVLIELTPDDDRPVETLTPLMEFIRQTFKVAGIETIHTAGMVPQSVEATEQARFNLRRLLPYTIVVLLVIVYILFLRMWPVLITMGLAAISILWTFGLAVVIDPKINLMMAMVPAVMLVVAFSDIIHLCSAYLLDLQAGLPKREAIVKSGAEVGKACFLTSITTLVGFAALAFVPAPVFRNLGLVLGFGVAIALLIAMTLVPIIFSWMPVPKDPGAVRRFASGKYLDRLLDSSLRLSLERPVAVAVGFVLVSVLALVGVAQMTVETNMLTRLSEDNRMRVAHRFVEEHFAGTNFVDVYVELSEDETSPESLLNAEMFAQLDEFQKQIEALADVDRVFSLVNVVDVIHAELAGDSEIALSSPLLAQYLLLFEMSGGEGLERVIDVERQRARFSIRFGEGGLIATANLGKQISELGKKQFGPRAEVSVTGLTYLFGEWIENILEGQKRGVLFAFISTTILMILGLGLVRAGLISMIPNTFPLLMLAGYLGWAWPTIDSDTLLVAMIAIGMAVDDTVHFMTRLKIEAAKTDDINEALQQTFHFTGRAIIKTTIILCLGFLPFSQSDYFSTRIMGTLLPFTLFMALVGDLYLLPALVKLGILRMPLRGDVTDSAHHPREPSPEAPR